MDSTDDDVVPLFIDPRDSAKYIAEKADHVKVDVNAVQFLSKEILDSMEEHQQDGFHGNNNNWHKHELHPSVADDHAIEWIFLIDSLNFSFWSDEESRGQEKYRVNGYSGYWSLCAAVDRCMRHPGLKRDDGTSKLDVTDARVCATITLSEMERLFESDPPGRTRIPLLKERMEILHENGRILIQKFDGKFKNCLTQCQNSAASLLRLVVESFPSFRDESLFKGRRVSFYKRAQILVADIWSCFHGKGDGFFHDIDILTMFPDYRVPQILAYKGVLKYSDHLVQLLRSGKELPFGDPMEIEIRGLSIHAIDLISKVISSMICDHCEDQPRISPSLHASGAGLAKDCGQEAGREVNGSTTSTRRSTSSIHPINSILIDFYLWDQRREKAMLIDSAGIPFHKTRCIFY